MQNLLADLLLIARDDAKIFFMERYNLSQGKYDLLKSFFDAYKTSSDLIEAKFVRQVFSACVQQRDGQIKASEQDLSRMINLLDTDNDGHLTFNQFVDLLNLSLARKGNLSTRMSQFLHTKNSDQLDQSQATKSLEFFNDFYKASSDSLTNAHNLVQSSDNLNVFNVLNTLTFQEPATTYQTRVVCNLKVFNELNTLTFQEPATTYQTRVVSKSYFTSRASVYFRDSLFV